MQTIPMKTPLTTRHSPRKNSRQWLSGMAFLAILSGCGGGDSHAASLQASTPPSLPPKPPSLPPKSPTTLPPPSTLPATGKVAFNCAAGAVTCVEVASSGAQTQASLPVTFGQPFKAGDWQHNKQDLIAQVDGATVPLQTDEISSHRDGSARFAVLSAQLANVPAGQKRIINLYTAQKANRPATTPAEPDWNLELEVKLYDANNNVVSTLVALPQAQLKTQITQNAGQRLKGPVATEYTVVTGFKDKSTGKEHPHLTARLHTRLYDAGQRIRTDVVLENTRTWTAGPGNLTYSLAVKRNGSAIYTQPKFTHYRHARWHKVLWTGTSAEPQAQVRHNMPYFMASKAIWNYDLKLNIPETVLSAFYSEYTKSKTNQTSLGPMANLMMTTYFPTTGGRIEIGPVPQWTAFYLISQDERMKEIMLAHGDVAGTVPVHYRDEATAHPLDLDKYPNVSTLRGTSQPALPAVPNGSTIWEPDTAHQGSFSYVPYLITGDAFYQEELSFWAAWNLTSMSPGYRSFGQGLLWEDQIRSHAWTMRALGDAARILPETHYQKAYFKQRLSNNLEWFYENWVVNPNRTQVPPTNTPISPYGLDITVPWQNDFLAISLSLHAENGEPRAFELVKWMSDFGVGRFLAESQGFCLSKAAAYNIKLKDSNNNFVSGWSALAKLNFPAFNCSTSIEYDGYPNWAGGYASNARTMLATTTSIGIPNARQAYDLWKSKTSGIDSDYLKNPTWAIIPR